VLGRVAVQDLQGSLHPGPGGHRGARGTPQVGVVEVRQPVRGGPYLAAHPPLFPGQHRLVCADPGEECTDRVAVADDDPVAAAHLARLRLHTQAPADTDQRERRLGGWAGDLERARPARLGERAVGEERAAPGRLGVGDAAGDDMVRQTLHRTAAQVDEAGLPGEPLAVLGDPDEVPAALADAAARDDLHLGAVPEDVGDLLAQPSGDRAGVEFGLDHDVPADEMKRACEAQHGRKFRLTRGHPAHRHPAEFVLHRRRHRHCCAPPPVPFVPSIGSGTPIALRIASLNRAASCRSALSSAASLDTTRRAPIPLT
jgi:hypothetical protein